jgi:hypothetical protein
VRTSVLNVTFDDTSAEATGVAFCSESGTPAEGTFLLLLADDAALTARFSGRRYCAVMSANRVLCSLTATVPEFHHHLCGEIAATLTDATLTLSGRYPHGLELSADVEPSVDHLEWDASLAASDAAMFFRGNWIDNSMLPVGVTIGLVRPASGISASHSFEA